MTQTNQNKDYTWQWLDDEFVKLLPLLGVHSLSEQQGSDLAEGKAAIQSHIEEHYIGKGEECPKCRGSRILYGRSPTDLPPKECDMCNGSGFFPRLYTESEVEQRCIEARLAENKENLSGFTHLAKDDFYRKEWLVDYFKARDDQLKRQLSTNNKDTLERSSDDRN